MSAITINKNESSSEQSAKSETNIFPTVVDVFVELRRSNFLPLARLLAIAFERNIDLSQRDYRGMTVLHCLIEIGQLALVRKLLIVVPSIAASCTRDGRTNAMLAASQPCVELFLDFLPKSIEETAARDLRGFTLHFHLVRNNAIALFVRLLLHEAELSPTRSLAFGWNARDGDGRGLVHWAAQRDALFLLKLLFRLGHRLDARDAAGLSPLDHARANNAMRCARFLRRVARFPLTTFSAFAEESDVLAPSRCALGDLSWRESFVDVYIRLNWRFGVGRQLYCVWMTVWLFVLWRVWRRNENAFESLLGGAVALGVLALATLVITLLFYSRNDLFSLTKVGERRYPPRFDANLFGLARESGYYAPSEKLAAYFAGAGFDEFLGDERSAAALAAFDPRRYCPICLIKRPRGTRHVWPLNLCVPRFELYSHFFGKAIFGRQIAAYSLVQIANAMLLLAALILAFAPTRSVAPRAIFRYAQTFGAIELTFVFANFLLFASLGAELFLLAFARARRATRDELLNAPKHFKE